MNRRAIDVSVLAHTRTNRVLAVTLAHGALNLLHAREATTTTNVVLASDIGIVGGPVTKLVDLITEPAKIRCAYRFDSAQKTSLFHDPNGPANTPELAAYARLCQKKTLLIARISTRISSARKQLLGAVTYDDRVSEIRRRQAERLLAAESLETEREHCAFVWQYAEVYEITPIQAAERILRENDAAEKSLLELEGHKLGLWERILAVKDVPDLQPIYEDFRRVFGGVT